MGEKSGKVGRRARQRTHRKVDNCARCGVKMWARCQCGKAFGQALCRKHHAEVHGYQMPAGPQDALGRIVG